LAEDRNYLVALVEMTTGVPAAEAAARVNAVVDSAKQNINRARPARWNCKRLDDGMARPLYSILVV
jgi:hypothetical protein